MFSIHGWSVSSNLPKLQTIQVTGSEQTAGSDTQLLKSKLKQQGASKEQGTVMITPENLGELWEKHINKASKSRENVTRGETGDFGDNAGHQNQVSTTKAHRETRSRRKNQDPTDNLLEEHTKRKSSRDRGNRCKKRVKLQHPGTSNTVELQQRQGSAEVTSSHNSKVAPIANTSKPLILPSIPTASDNVATLTPLQSSMRQKLVSARFRYLNQVLYTTPSSSSSDLFRANPTFFAEYHEGFQRQIGAWPENPVLTFVSWILDRSVDVAESNPQHRNLISQKSSFRKSKAQARKGPPHYSFPVSNRDSQSPAQIDRLPRDRRSDVCIIVDLGCGTALLAQTLAPGSQSLKLKIHSFDLCAPNPLVIAADISKIPLPDSSVDVAISCLALMGTNWLDFVEEAYRLLRWKGEYWVAEVASRFVTKGLAPKLDVRDRGKKMEKEGEHSTKMDRKTNVDGGTQIEGQLLSEEDWDLSAGKTSRAAVWNDFSPFIEVLRSRGFELIGEPELGNKMFARMRFVKGLIPVRGKGTAQDGHVRNRKVQQKRFLESASDREGLVGIEDEAKVLKPCIYKIR